MSDVHLSIDWRDWRFGLNFSGFFAIALGPIYIWFTFRR